MIIFTLLQGLGMLDKRLEKNTKEFCEPQNLDPAVHDSLAAIDAMILDPVALRVFLFVRLDLRGLMDRTLNTLLATKNLEQKKNGDEKSYPLRGDGDVLWNDDVTGNLHKGDSGRSKIAIETCHLRQLPKFRKKRACF